MQKTSVIQKPKKGMKSNAVWGYFFVMPWLLFFAVFLVYPLLLAFMNSFLDVSMLQPEKSTFLGFENWVNVLKDPLFWRSLMNIFFNQSIFIVLSLVLGLFFAALLNEIKFAGSIFRTIYFIPVVMSVTVALFIFDQLAEPYGVIQLILMKLGWLQQPVFWRMTEWLPMPVIAIFSAWKWFGIQVVILLGGIATIDKEIYEAAEIDGASWTQRFFNITLPLLRPQIIFIVTVNIINGLQMFTEVWVQQRDIMGGPYHSFLTPVLLLYGQAFQYDHMGYASTIGIFLAVVIFVLTRIQFGITKFDREEGL